MGQIPAGDHALWSRPAGSRGTHAAGPPVQLGQLRGVSALPGLTYTLTAPELALEFYMTIAIPLISPKTRLSGFECVVLRPLLPSPAAVALACLEAPCPGLPTGCGVTLLRRQSSFLSSAAVAEVP